MAADSFGRKLTLTINSIVSAPAVSKAVITSKKADSDFVSFASAAAGGSREYALSLTVVQDPQASSLWDSIFSAAGTDVTVLVRPYGNATATAAQPHFSGTVTISEPEGDFFGGSADASTTARWTTDVEWIFTAKPTRIVA